MSIILPKTLPAGRQLNEDGLTVLSPCEAAVPPPLQGRAVNAAATVGLAATHEPVARPLEVLLVNLMPHKPAAEAQWGRLLAQTNHRVALTLSLPQTHEVKTTPASHLDAFYKPWPDLQKQRFDGLIITGAPIEMLPFEEVNYWSELTEILDWAETSVLGSLFVCWAGQAALYHRHGVGKHPLPAKAFGVFEQQIHCPEAAILEGLGGNFPCPVSRHTEVRRDELPAGRGLRVLADSPESGLCLVEDQPQRAYYLFNHMEYDADTLGREYQRDSDAGLAIDVPSHYFPDNDPARTPERTWAADAERLIGNWVNGLSAARIAAFGRTR